MWPPECFRINRLCRVYFDTHLWPLKYSHPTVLSATLIVHWLLYYAFPFVIVFFICVCFPYLWRKCKMFYTSCIVIIIIMIHMEWKNEENFRAPYHFLFSSDRFVVKYGLKTNITSMPTRTPTTTTHSKISHTRALSLMNAEKW